MASFANSVMTVLLSWVSGIASALWGFFSPDAQGSAWINWFSNNWWIAALVLIVVCMVIDLLVYMLRWRPNRVWATFFRHLRGKYEVDLAKQQQYHSANAGSADVQVRRWVYANGTAREEILPRQEAAEPVAVAEPEAESIVEPEAESIAVEDPPVVLMETAPVEPAPRRRRSTELHPEPTEKRPSRLRRLLSDETGQQSFRYQPAPSAGSKEDKYNGPYYPPQYVKPGENTYKDD